MPFQSRYSTTGTKSLSEEAKGYEAFQHGNAGRKPARAFCENVKERVMEVALLYRETSCQHISELIKEEDGVCISAKSIIRILIAVGYFMYKLLADDYWCFTLIQAKRLCKLL